MVREMTVVPYDEAWSELYSIEEQLIESILGKLIVDIQHFGSTSIKGMSAKPIIDIIIVIDNIDEIDGYEKLMAENGYEPRGENGIEGRRYFVKFAPDGSGNHTHHVHIYRKGNPHITDELMFRDYLRIDFESFKEYEQVKLDASHKYRYSPRDYVEAKCSCVMGILERARRHYRTTMLS